MKLSEDYQVQLPREICEQHGIEPGTEFELLVRHGHVHLVPLRPLREMRGRARGIDTSLENEPDRY
jgi:bifunctional DNA-binding transcriptional regulator/antitoxin component of YhaV-PrlF toxin-antitoxin module